VLLVRTKRDYLKKQLNFCDGRLQPASITLDRISLRTASRCTVSVYISCPQFPLIFIPRVAMSTWLDFDYCPACPANVVAGITARLCVESHLSLCMCVRSNSPELSDLGTSYFAALTQCVGDICNGDLVVSVFLMLLCCAQTTESIIIGPLSDCNLDVLIFSYQI